MTLQTDITTIQDTIDDIETAIINKGVTPSGGLATFASAITNIPAPIGIPREVSQNGTYQVPTTSFTFSLPSNATDLGNYALYYGFYNCTGLTSVDLSSLTTIYGSYALTGAFYGCTSLTSVDVSSLSTILGFQNFYYTFRDCTGLTSVDLSSLTTIYANQSFYAGFSNCISLTSVDLSSLTTIYSSNAFGFAFSGCISLDTLSFPALKSTSFGSYTNQFNGMLSGITGCTVHFPSNLQSVIGSWSSVISGFGGTNTTVLFDLPATT